VTHWIATDSQLLSRLRTEICKNQISNYPHFSSQPTPGRGIDCDPTHPLNAKFEARIEARRGAQAEATE